MWWRRKKRVKKLFIEELEIRRSTSPLFVSPPSEISSGIMPNSLTSGREKKLPKFLSHDLVTTQALGEEGNPPQPPSNGITTQALGEEGNPPKPPSNGITTQALGEEGNPPQPFVPKPRRRNDFFRDIRFFFKRFKSFLSRLF